MGWEHWGEGSENAICEPLKRLIHSAWCGKISARKWQSTDLERKTQEKGGGFHLEGLINTSLQLCSGEGGGVIKNGALARIGGFFWLCGRGMMTADGPWKLPGCSCVGGGSHQGRSAWGGWVEKN
jgi:hypothetical protein